MVTIDEPPLIRGAKYIIILTIILSLTTPRLCHEAFDNCCPPPAPTTLKPEHQEALLLVVSKEFAPEIKKPVSYAYGNGSCVPYARYKTGIQLTGWAGTLLERANEAGYATSTIPAQGGMLITSEGGGHVAVVEEVKGDAIVISEQNYVGRGIVSTREIPMDDPIIQGYIHE